MLYVVAAILRMLRDLRTLPVCSSIMLDEYPTRTGLVIEKLVYYI